MGCVCVWGGVRLRRLRVVQLTMYQRRLRLPVICRRVPLIPVQLLARRSVIFGRGRRCHGPNSLWPSRSAEFLMAIVLATEVAAEVQRRASVTRRLQPAAFSLLYPNKGSCAVFEPARSVTGLRPHSRGPIYSS